MKILRFLMAPLLLLGIIIAICLFPIAVVIRTASVWVESMWEDL